MMPLSRRGTRLSEEHRGGMMTQPSVSTAKSLFGALILRGVALGGRFVFVIFATKYMLPGDFGRFGLLAGLALIIPLIVGLEAYQILLRRILQEPERAPGTRRSYATFVLAGSLVSGATGALTLACFGWSATEVCLGAVVLIFEHIGLETNRNLVNEGRPALSVLSVALRSGAWGVVVPALFFVGLISAPWTFETVLCFWILGSIGAVLAGMPIWPLFRPHGRDLDLRRSAGQLKELASRSRTWLIFAGSTRVIETGGRFVCAWMISEAAAGRFTFVSMLASLSYIVQQGVVEPFYYARLTALDATEETYREFRHINLLAIVGATLCSVVGLAASAWLNGVLPPELELVSFGLLCLAFACLSLTRSAHYRLYRSHKDKAIMRTGIAGCVAMVLTSIVATWLWGVVGAALGMLLGTLVLLILKGRAARELIPVRPGN
jgi:O-antigen/teichoic acid export membrane protein